MSAELNTLFRVFSVSLRGVVPLVSCCARIWFGCVHVTAASRLVNLSKVGVMVTMNMCSIFTIRHSEGQGVTRQVPSKLFSG
jgi:hypothetical protein